MQWFSSFVEAALRASRKLSKGKDKEMSNTCFGTRDTPLSKKNYSRKATKWPFLCQRFRWPCLETVAETLAQQSCTNSMKVRMPLPQTEPLAEWVVLWKLMDACILLSTPHHLALCVRRWECNLINKTSTKQSRAWGRFWSCRTPGNVITFDQSSNDKSDSLQDLFCNKPGYLKICPCTSFLKSQRHKRVRKTPNLTNF